MRGPRPHSDVVDSCNSISSAGCGGRPRWRARALREANLGASAWCAVGALIGGGLNSYNRGCSSVCYFLPIRTPMHSPHHVVEMDAPSGQDSGSAPPPLPPSDPGPSPPVPADSPPPLLPSPSSISPPSPSSGPSTSVPEPSARRRRAPETSLSIRDLRAACMAAGLSSEGNKKVLRKHFDGRLAARVSSLPLPIWQGPSPAPASTSNGRPAPIRPLPRPPAPHNPSGRQPLPPHTSSPPARTPSSGPPSPCPALSRGHVPGTAALGDGRPESTTGSSRPPALASARACAPAPCMPNSCAAAPSL